MTLINRYKNLVNFMKKMGLKRKLFKKINKRVLKIVRILLRETEVNIDENKLFLDSLDSLDLSLNTDYESYITKVIKKELKKGDIFLDLGANIGFFTLIAAKIVGDTGKVYAFEPDTTNFNLLKKNIDYNHYKNIILVNKAVSDYEGQGELYLSKDNFADHRTFYINNDRDKTKINIIKLDNFFTKWQKINFIKMDIQGDEYKAFLGMLELIKRSDNLKMVFEYYPEGIKQRKQNVDEFLKQLYELFDVYLIRNKDVLKITKQELDMLCPQEFRKENEAVNLYCIKKEIIEKEIKNETN